jgi:CheY-like chemotaxis protein
MTRRADRVQRGRRPGTPAEAEAPLRRVLVVEDDAEFRVLLAGVLRRHGFDVQTARDGSEALDKLGSLVMEPSGRWAPDLVITDYRMPRFDGMDVIEALRLAVVSAPIILITAFGDAATHRRAESLGVWAVLDKPFELPELVALARSATEPRN